ncbi:MAG: phosphatase PAP2 family protein [Gemmatimonadetes bacterium]|nr:phosphatase PAP2 family protein [Gemmatimonadota bacterium]
MRVRRSIVFWLFASCVALLHASEADGQSSVYLPIASGLREIAPLPSRQARGRRPLHDFAGTAIDFGRDFWYTLTAPARMDHGDWLASAGVIGVGGLLFLVDNDIARAALRNRHEPVFDEIGDLGTFIEPVGLMGNTNVWYATGAVASWAVGWDRPKRLFTELLYSHWIAGLIRGGTNRLVGRYRPHDGRGARHFAFGGGTSFPSGHASTVFQVAAVLSHHADRAPVTVLAYALAGVAAWERINAEQHWASDIWLGAAYGWAGGEARHPAARRGSADRAAGCDAVGPGRRFAALPVLTGLELNRCGAPGRGGSSPRRDR